MVKESTLKDWEKGTTMRDLKPTDHNIIYDKFVKKKCKIGTNSGVMVQSYGEKAIADFLFSKGIKFIYDDLVKSNLGWTRPDFFICDEDEGVYIVIEYWGMWDRGYKANPTYDKRYFEKMDIYEMEGYDVIEIFKDQVEEVGKIIMDRIEEYGYKLRRGKLSRAI